MRDICSFVSAPAPSIGFSHFVYEMELSTLPQPFYSPHYYMYLVVIGEGVLLSGGKAYPLSPGTLVLIRPWEVYEIKEKTALTFLYISFHGDGAEAVLNEIGVSPPLAVFEGYVHLIDFWIKSIRRINAQNAVYVTSSVFMHTVSLLVGNEGKDAGSGISAIISYVQENLSDPELSLRRVARMFYYSEKYFSSFFAKSTGTKFTDYLSTLRVNYAVTLIEEGKRSVTELSALCGFDNSYYFSKVFKRIKGVSPTAFIKGVRG